VSTGKLYRHRDKEFIADVNYQFHDDSTTSWWGELTLVQYVRLNDNDEYVIELEDARRGRCRLRKRVNRAVIGVPPRYVYQFHGLGALELEE
jgi:hypothetical protein